MTPATIVGPAIRYLISESTGQKIPTIAARGLVFSAWEPSPEEIEALKQGAILWLVQRGTYIPEMSMIVGRQEDVVPRDLQLEAMEDVSPDRQRLIEELTAKREAILHRAALKDMAIGVFAAALFGFLIGSIIRRTFGW